MRTTFTLALMAILAFTSPMLAQETPAQLENAVELMKRLDTAEAELASTKEALAEAQAALTAKIAELKAQVAASEARATAAETALMSTSEEAISSASALALATTNVTGLKQQLAAMEGWIDPAFQHCTPIKPKARPKPQVAKAKHVAPTPAKKPVRDNGCNCTIELKEGDHFVNID
jgi:hypothetical protein